MKQLIVFLFTCLLFPVTLSAQLTGAEVEMAYRALNDGRPIYKNSNRLFDIRYHGAVGTQYAEDHWKPVIMYLNSGQERYHALANYDEVEESPVIIGDTGEPIHIAPILVDHFTLTGIESSRSYYQFVHPKKKRTTYIFCEPLNTGKVTLYIYKRKYFVPADLSNPTYNVQQYAEFKYMKDLYFLGREGSNEIEVIKKSNRGLRRQLGSHQEEMKRFMKENLLYARYGKDLQPIIEHFNSLISQ